MQVIVFHDHEAKALRNAKYVTGQHNSNSYLLLPRRQLNAEERDQQRFNAIHAAFAARISPLTGRYSYNTGRRLEKSGLGGELTPLIRKVVPQNGAQIFCYPPTLLGHFELSPCSNYCDVVSRRGGREFGRIFTAFPGEVFC